MRSAEMAAGNKCGDTARADVHLESDYSADVVTCCASSPPGEHCRCVQQELCYQLHLLQKCLPSLDPRSLLKTIPQQSDSGEGEAVKSTNQSDDV